MRLHATSRALTALLAVSAFSLLSAASGCTSTEEHTFIVAADGSVQELSTTKPIGSSGGTLEVTNPDDPAYGTELEVPAGAVDRNTPITVSADATVQGTPFGTRGAGPAIKIEPLDLVFNTGKAAKLTLPYRLDAKTGERLVVLRRSSASGLGTRAAGDSPTGDWEILVSRGTGDDSRRVVVDTDRLGLFVVALAPESVQLPDGGGDSTVIPLPDAIGTLDGNGGDGPGTGNDQRPPVFTGLQTAELEEDQGQVNAILSWNPAIDDQSPAAQIRYRLYLPSFATVGQPQGESAPGATSLSVRVARGVTYYFLIRAVDAAGNEDSNLRILSIVVPTGQIGRRLGEACTENTECQSNACADKVCCESACDGACSFCANQGSEGRCQAAAEGTDPREQCGDAGAGTVLLCGADQTCSQCKATANGEICNNGKDDNDDGLSDAQDPACAACLGPLVCVTEPARLFQPDNYFSRATSVASDGLSTLGLGLQDSTDFQSIGARAALGRSSLVEGFLDSLLVQGPNSTEGSPDPVVVRGEGEWALFYDVDDAQSFNRMIVAARISDAGALIGTPVTVVPSTDFSVNSFTALATGDGGYRVLYTYNSGNGQSVELAAFSSSLEAQGTPILLGDDAGLTSYDNLTLLDDRGASQVVALFRRDSKSDGRSYQAARLGYTATTATPVELTGGPFNHSTSQFVAAVVGNGATPNALMLAYSYFDTSSNLVIGTQRYSGALAPTGTEGLVNYFLLNSSLRDLKMSAHPGQDVVLFWSEVPSQSFYANIWMTRFDPSTAQERSSMRVSDVDYSLSNTNSLGGITPAGLHHGFAVNRESKGVGVATGTFCDPATRPGNDTCATAFPLEEGEVQFGSTGSASDDGPLGTCTTAGRDVYYTVTANTSLQVTVVSAYGSVAAIDVADACAPTTCQSSDGPVSGGPTSGYAYMFLSSGQTYVIRVRVTAGTSGADYAIALSNAS